MIYSKNRLKSMTMYLPVYNVLMFTDITKEHLNVF